MKQILLLSFILLSSYAYSQSVEEDILYLKDGNVIHGVVTEISADGAIVIRTTKGYLRKYQLSEMDHIVKANKDALEKGERTVDSQTQKGTVSLRGSVYYSSIYVRDMVLLYYSNGRGYYEISEYESSSLNFLPTVGFFLIDNLSANLMMNIESVKNDDETFDFMSFGLMLNYYFGVEASKPFVSAGIQFSREDDFEEGYGYTIGAGYNLAIARNVSLQPMVQYFSNTIADESSGVLHAFTIGVGIETFIF